MPKQPSIFINYRREKCRDKAIILRILLELHFGEDSVFLDETSITLGAKWEDSLEKAVKGAEVMLSLIHHRWHADQFDSGLRRLDDTDDWVRREILAAKKHDVSLIPILIDGAEQPKDEWLPAEIGGLFKSQGIKLDFKDLSGTELKKLLQDLRVHVKRRKSKSTSPAQADHNLHYPYYQDAVQERFPLPDDLRKGVPDTDIPFVGLKPFTEQEARIFYGRSREIYEFCFKIVYHEAPRVLLLDGYSGTGKSSLLQAGIIPRIKAQGWAVVYGRREEDKLEGLSGVFQRLLRELEETPKEENTLLILDQVEEAINNPIDIRPDELEDLVHLLNKAVIAHPRMKFILGFRSEHTARIKKLLSDYELKYDGENTLFPLNRNGILEAITGVSRDRELRQEKYPIFFKPPDVPYQIADRLLSGRLGYYVAPLLQVNMKLLWEKGQQDGAVDITGAMVENLIDSYEKLLDHYLAEVRKEIAEETAGDYEVLSVLRLFVEQKPTAATRLETEILNNRESIDERRLPRLLTVLNDLYLLTQHEQGNQRITRLTHDVLAEEIQQRYDRLRSRRLDESLNQTFELLLKDLKEQLRQLQYQEAQETLRQLMDQGIRHEELAPYFFELLFFWNECRRETELRELLQRWLNAKMLTEAAEHQAEKLLEDPDREKVRAWLRALDKNRYADLQNQYLAPPGTCLVEVKGGTFKREKGGEVTLDNFRIANVPTTFRKYGLYLYATGEEKRLEDIAPNWGVQADHPVVNINWYNAVEYCNWLSLAQGLAPVYTIDKDQKDPNNQSEHDKIKWLVTADFQANGFRLPTEAEWEYAAQGGAGSYGYEYAGSNDLDEVGWYRENADGKTHPVARKQPNELGLYDMSGNVWEWCWDWSGAYPSKPTENPGGPEKGSQRVFRGGSWYYVSRYCRTAHRYAFHPDIRYVDQGFRLVCVPQFQAGPSGPHL